MNLLFVLLSCLSMAYVISFLEVNNWHLYGMLQGALLAPVISSNYP